MTLLFVLTPTMAIAKQKTGRWGEVKEALFGEVLFDYYQGRYFSAITSLSMAEAQGAIRHHRQHADLLMIGMAMSYGMHGFATERLESLRKSANEYAIQDRIRFFIGKMKYQKGEYADATAALTSINEPLPGDLEQEKAEVVATEIGGVAMR